MFQWREATCSGVKQSVDVSTVLVPKEPFRDGHILGGHRIGDRITEVLIQTGNRRRVRGGWPVSERECMQGMAIR